jgi:ribosomal protein S18 acetylase RimI-like enzyme
MEPKVRTATLDDVEAISIIHVNAWNKAYRDVMPEAFLNSITVKDRMSMWTKALSVPGKGIYVVSEHNGEVQGFAVLGPARDDDISNTNAGELVALNVNPEAWSCGVGSALLNHVIEFSHNEKWKSLYLWVIESNSRAIHLYERFGFEREGMIKIETLHSGSPITEHRYVKNLYY